MAASASTSYAETLDKMKIPQSSLLPSKASFYGVIPGKEVVPLGRIRLHVTSHPPFGPLVQAFSSALHCSRSIKPGLRI
jgi:phosphodiesterase/alkaline phosphatase D-like protein